MTRKAIFNSVRVLIITGIFSAGFLCGSLTQHKADAQSQWEEMGGEMLKKAGESDGTVGGIVQLGTTINDMEKNVGALQKNIDTLKKVKASLGVR